MCGILYVKSVHDIPRHRHDRAIEQLKNRGKDFTFTYQDNHCFAAHSVLHITGSDQYYQQAANSFFAYNGEIYNYRKFGAWSTDTELARHAAINDPTLFRQFEGPWAWLSIDDQLVRFATDPQGERCLYYYQDSEWFIVASEVSLILNYIATKHQHLPYNNKCWSMIEQTPWQGIKRCQPGVLYTEQGPTTVLDSIWSWIDSQPLDHTLETAERELTEILTQVIQDQIPVCGSAISYSAGIDSNIILANHCLVDELLAVNIVGKDSVVVRAADFLTQSCAKLNVIDVDEPTWAQHYRDMLAYTKMPVHWSHVGKWIVSKHTQQSVIFTGAAADELFGGYAVYNQIAYDQEKSHSPYSIDDHDQLWSQCLHAYRGCPQQATLLMDYWYQVVGVDAPGLDRAAGRWCREVRNPFMHPKIIKYALNLPVNLKINVNTKLLLKKIFCQHWDQHLMLPKMGFAGHANDSVAWLGIDFEPTGNRLADWKIIAQRTFYEHTKI